MNPVWHCDHNQWVEIDRYQTWSGSGSNTEPPLNAPMFIRYRCGICGIEKTEMAE